MGLVSAQLVPPLGGPPASSRSSPSCAAVERSGSGRRRGVDATISMGEIDLEPGVSSDRYRRPAPVGAAAPLAPDGPRALAAARAPAGHPGGADRPPAGARRSALLPVRPLGVRRARGGPPPPRGERGGACGRPAEPCAAPTGLRRSEAGGARARRWGRRAPTTATAPSAAARMPTRGPTPGSSGGASPSVTSRSSPRRVQAGRRRRGSGRSPSPGTAWRGRCTGRTASRAAGRAARMASRPGTGAPARSRTARACPSGPHTTLAHQCMP